MLGNKVFCRYANDLYCEELFKLKIIKNNKK